MNWPMNPITPKPRLKASRGRGNQGDYRKTLIQHPKCPEHHEHNEAIEAKRLEKLARREAKKRGK